MPDILRPDAFSASKLSEVQNFHCGDAPWAIAQTAYITGGFVTSMQRGTEVWLYYDSADQVVGFGSLGECRRPFPPGSTEYMPLSIIPALAVDTKHQKNGYSSQILLDLIRRARSKESKLLTLDVHQSNIEAISLYRKHRFFDFGYVRNEHLKMFHRLGNELP